MLAEARKDKDKKDEILRQFPPCNSETVTGKSARVWCTTLRYFLFFYFLSTCYTRPVKCVIIFIIIPIDTLILYESRFNKPLIREVLNQKNRK